MKMSYCSLSLLCSKIVKSSHRNSEPQLKLQLKLRGVLSIELQTFSLKPEQKRRSETRERAKYIKRAGRVHYSNSLAASFIIIHSWPQQLDVHFAQRPLRKLVRIQSSQS